MQQISPPVQLIWGPCHNSFESQFRWIGAFQVLPSELNDTEISLSQRPACWFAPQDTRRPCVSVRLTTSCTGAGWSPQHPESDIIHPALVQPLCCPICSFHPWGERERRTTIAVIPATVISKLTPLSLCPGSHLLQWYISISCRGHKGQSLKRRCPVREQIKRDDSNELTFPLCRCHKGHVCHRF